MPAPACHSLCPTELPETFGNTFHLLGLAGTLPAHRAWNSDFAVWLHDHSLWAGDPRALFSRVLTFILIAWPKSPG